MARTAYRVQVPFQTSWHTPPRVLTSTALYDGHDVAINIVRRLLLNAGAEVIHLGHNRSVEEIARAALQEDAHAIAISSYQGGHMEFFRYLVDTLARQRLTQVQIFGGGGGTITPSEARELEASGVTRIYTADDGLELGLQGMVRDVIERIQAKVSARLVKAPDSVRDHRAIAQTLSCFEREMPDALALIDPLRGEHKHQCPVIGISGTGGAGKSSLIDELMTRFFRDVDDLTIAYLTNDPTRHHSGGALLGDRIRINNTVHPQLFLRSMATRRKHRATSATLARCVAWLRSLGFDLILVETAGTGQGDAEITELADISIYVMTSDFGAPGQLEKIEMLNYADLIAVNKADRAGSADALEELQRYWRLNRGVANSADEVIPTFATHANRFGDAGIDALYRALCIRLNALPMAPPGRFMHALEIPSTPTRETDIIPSARARHLGEISELGRRINTSIVKVGRAATKAQSYYRSLEALGDPDLPRPLESYASSPLESKPDSSLRKLRRLYNDARDELGRENLQLLKSWPAVRNRYENDQYHYSVRGQDFVGDNYTETLSRSRIPKIALPHTEDWGELLRFLLKENLPGHYPFTAGVFPYRRTSEDPTRMFAGEGIPERTNRRFHVLAHGQRAIRLSTAFDPIALYGQDPNERPDVYGRIGMSGVSVATLDDFKRLYSGFDLCQPNTSVSMTINGPGPIALACFINTAIDQQIEQWLHGSGQWSKTEAYVASVFRNRPRPHYRGKLPTGHDRLGLGLLGVSGRELVDLETYSRIRKDTLSQLRGTLQADILKEDQAQNECLFPIEFALRLMGDVQEFIVSCGMHNYYGVSVSGYHIAEAGANPITQLAFTLANGFTLVEYFLARGMAIDDIAPHLSFFFSNGLDIEYAVIGRVARRIWARAMRERYGANKRSQQLKYHIQTSGRSLQAQEIGLNDIRTTLQACCAIFDNCNSLHTNAYDEAVTTPTEASVRRALAIQMILQREFGLVLNENNLQGSFIIEELTDLVEEAVYHEFDLLSDRGGVLNAMEVFYQRRRIQEESLRYEQGKADGSLPIVGVNTFLADKRTAERAEPTPLVRSTDEEKRAQIQDVITFKQHHAESAQNALARMREVTTSGGNVFAELLDTVHVATLGQITHALYAVAGRYRRSL